MSERQAVYSLSVCGRAILDMHSLNNEGGEGNQIATRMVNVVYRDRASGEYKLATVNAVSGDMFKHIQAEHLYLLAKGKLPLCAGCQKFSTSRILDDAEFISTLPPQDSAVIDTLLKRCALDDMEGNLIAKGARSVPRKSVAEFGWVVGVPDHTTTESYFHVRYAAERGERAEGAQQQAIFHRPASSGVYAIVANFEMARIGFNDISQQYPIADDEREGRYLALLESILYTFIEPSGAMRGTQNPHIVEFEGVVTVTNQVMPAPALSPLDENYRQDVEKVAGALNGLKPGAVTVHRFDSMGQFAEVMKELIGGTRPYKLAW
ncbi:MAG: DevR family CRISPR-associated autoregulator [candidate division KSB1 bacterium]|nr:DevR family CRISPR-associated autoregulator [candidate division KSB1 bacterium]